MIVPFELVNVTLDGLQVKAKFTPYAVLAARARYRGFLRETQQWPPLIFIYARAAQGPQR